MAYKWPTYNGIYTVYTVDYKDMHWVFCQIIFIVCASFLAPLLGCTFFSNSLCFYLAIYYRFAAFFLSALPNSSKADIPKGVLQGSVLGHVTVTCMVTLEGGARDHVTVTCMVILEGGAWGHMTVTCTVTLEGGAWGHVTVTCIGLISTRLTYLLHAYTCILHTTSLLRMHMQEVWWTTLHLLTGEDTWTSPTTLRCTLHAQCLRHK